MIVNSIAIMVMVVIVICAAITIDREVAIAIRGERLNFGFGKRAQRAFHSH